MTPGREEGLRMRGQRLGALWVVGVWPGVFHYEAGLCMCILGRLLVQMRRVNGEMDGIAWVYDKLE